MSKGLLLLDVDGPLNPFASTNRLRKEAGFRKYHILEYNVWLHDNHGPMLTNFAAENNLEMVWATTWEHQANEYIGWRIGLPELPVIEFNKGKWKTESILEYADGRNLLWFDDDFNFFKADVDTFIATRTAQNLKTYCYAISPCHGIRQENLDECNTFLRSP